MNKLDLDSKQKEYIYEKNVNLNDDMRIELTDKVIGFFEEHRKEANHEVV